MPTVRLVFGIIAGTAISLAILVITIRAVRHFGGNPGAIVADTTAGITGLAA